MRVPLSGSVGFYDYECHARQSGYARPAGIDEVGRGPLAGPVVAAVVGLPNDYRIDGLNDSKQLTANQRQRLYDGLTQCDDIRFAVAEVDVATIARVNILQATHLAMRLAAAELDPAPDFLFVDGRPVPNLPCEHLAIVKGDSKCACIAAASIIAKVHRDRLMDAYDREFPEYGFARHKGYGTRLHMDALERFGPCPIHRTTFAPVARLLAEDTQGTLRFDSSM